MLSILLTEVDPGYIVQADESNDVDVGVRVEFIYSQLKSTRGQTFESTSSIMKRHFNAVEYHQSKYIFLVRECSYLFSFVFREYFERCAREKHFSIFAELSSFSWFSKAA